MADHDTPPDNAGSSSDDLAALQRKLEEARARDRSRAPTSGGGSGSGGGSTAARFAGEFGAAVIVGGLLGFGVDYWLETRPWGLIAGLGLGFLAGVINVVRAAQAYSAANPVDPNAPSVPDDGQD